MYRAGRDMRDEIRPNLRGGNGDILTKHLFEASETHDKANLLAIMTIEPGCSIGEHPHGPDAELYYLLEGTLEADDNGTPRTMHPGDALFTGGGDTHSVTNKTDQTARILAAVLR